MASVLVDPTGSSAAASFSLAPRRFRDLNGKRVGLLNSTKFNSDKLLVKIGEILKSEYGAADYTMWRKHNSSVPAHQEILDEARRGVDCVVAGIGD